MNATAPWTTRTSALAWVTGAGHMVLVELRLATAGAWHAPAEVTDLLLQQAALAQRSVRPDAHTTPGCVLSDGPIVDPQAGGCWRSQLPAEGARSGTPFVARRRARIADSGALGGSLAVAMLAGVARHQPAL